MSLSTEAREYLGKLSQAYVKSGFPNYKVWRFDGGKNDPCQRELAANGMIELMGTKGGSWRLTDEGHSWILAHQERDEIRWARAVFSKFSKMHAERLGAGGCWWLRSFDEADAEEVGLELSQAMLGIAVLLHKGLIDADASREHNFELTAMGKDVCLHPETLEASLGPRSGATGIVVDAHTSNTFNAPMHNVQIGDGNIQNVTYSTVLQQLVQQIEQDPNIEPDKKSRWVDAVKDIMASGLGSAVVAGIQAALS